MPLNLTLAHNSGATEGKLLGNRWTHSFDITLAADASGNEWVHWGDNQCYQFALSMGTFTAPTGIFQTLVQNGDGSFTLTTHEQIQYHFPHATAGCDTITDTNGNQIALAYGARGVSTITDPTGRTITFTYDSSGRIQTITDPLSRVWTISYDGNNQLTQIQLPAVGGNTYYWKFGYDANANGYMTGITDPRGYTSTATYDATYAGVCRSVADPYGNTVSFSLPPTTGASSTTVTDPNGNATTYYYTSGLNTSVKDAAGKTSYFGYDVNYCRNAVTDARGYTWNYSYDSNGNVIDSEDPYGDITPQYYFIDNKPLFVIYPTGEGTIFSYDGGENLTAVYHMSQGTWTSPPTMGGQGTGYNWGSVMAIENYTNNAYGERTDYYDANSHHYQYGYDNNGDLASVTTPLGRETQWTYDALGFCTSREDAMSRTTDYTPDGWERLTTITYPDTSTHSFVYDADSNLTQMTDGTGTTTRTYDNADRITSEAVGGTTHVTYNWDQTGQKGLLGNIVTADGRTITYTYTARNQLYTVSDSFGTTTYSYDADGNEVGIAKPDTETVTKVYDHMSRLTSTTDQTNGSVTLASFAYQYDADSRVTQMTEADGSKVVYGYDWGGRLTSEVRTGTSPYSISYTPDLVGNRVSETSGAATTALNYDNDDELTSTTSSTGGFVNSYSYDLNGEQTGRTLAGTAYTLAYDYDGQLLSIVNGSTTVSSFAYDALGRRVSRTNGGTTTSFLFDGGSVVAQNVSGTYQMPTTFGNQPIRSGSELPIYDAQGNQRAVTASNQTVTGTQIFDAFGNKASATGSTASALQWQGASLYRTYSPDAGLLQAGARYYDPQVGRFITRDTDLSQHPYIYTGGDPVTYVDPDGHFEIPWIKVVIWGAGLALGGLVWEGWQAYKDINEYGYGNKERFRRMRADPRDSWVGNRPDDPRPSDPNWSTGNTGWNPADPDDPRGPGGRVQAR